MPRYRRVLTFGDVLDESIQVFRQHWVSFAVLSAVALLPPGLVAISLSASGVLSRTSGLFDFQNGRPVPTAALSEEITTLFASSLVSTLFFLLWTSAVVAASDAVLRGAEPRLWPVYATALRRYWAVFLASLVIVVGLSALTLIGSVLFVFTGFGVAGSLVALVAVLVWWLRLRAGKSWVKWLIILAAPFGLPMYFLGRWSMFIPAVVLERHGPIGALRRSSQLVDRHWFRVVSILAVAGLIVAILQSAPATLIEIPLTLRSATRGQIGFAPAEAAMVNAVAVILEVLFASIGSIVYTLLFVDLRNRREGADIFERLSQLETEPASTNG